MKCVCVRERDKRMQRRFVFFLQFFTYIVGTIGVIGDSTESHGLALCAIHGPTLVESTQLRIVFGNNADGGFENRSWRWIFQDHFSLFQKIIGSLNEWLAIQFDRDNRDGSLVSVQDQIVLDIGIPFNGWILFEKQFGSDNRLAISNIKIHVDFIDDNIEGFVVLSKDFDGCVGDRSLGLGGCSIGTHLQD